MQGLNHLVCNCRTRRKLQTKVSSEPQQFLDSSPVCFCTSCDAISDPVVYRHNRWFTFFDLPVFRFKKGPELLCCSLCTEELYVGSLSNICTGCGLYNFHTSNYCPDCGTPFHAT